MKTIYTSIYITLALIFTACSGDENPKDATGVFESTEIIISAETPGKILSLDVREGDVVSKDQSLGQIDSAQIHLSKMQALANKEAILASLPDVRSQIKATEREIEKAKTEKKRIENLLEGDVATQKQLDDINAQIDILEARLAAQRSSLATSTQAINAQSKAIDVQIETLEDQLRRSSLLSPIDGTILVKYAEAGEVTSPGKPLLKIANLDEMILKAYVSADQLPKISVGQELEVLAEFGKEELKSYSGKVTWISAKSEFTPKTIQTQDERANLVYAIKVSVQNDGQLKIGMYGGIKFIGE